MGGELEGGEEEGITCNSVQIYELSQGCVKIGAVRLAALSAFLSDGLQGYKNSSGLC